MHKPLLEFVHDQSRDADIFCFQEVFDSPKSEFRNGFKTDLYADLSELLKGYNSYYAPMFTGYDTERRVNFPLSFGQATFVRKNIKVSSEKAIFIHGKYDYKPSIKMEGIKNALDLPRNIQCLRIKVGKKEILVGNVHGYWIPGEKMDTPERIAQSKAIKKISDSFSGEKIICGDFNLSPNTESLKILEENMKNLIKEFSIKGTRTHHYKKTSERYADYILVSGGIKVKTFEVPEIIVSDHLPMILEFSV